MIRKKLIEALPEGEGENPFGKHDDGRGENR